MGFRPIPEVIPEVYVWLRGVWQLRGRNESALPRFRTLPRSGARRSATLAVADVAIDLHLLRFSANLADVSRSRA
jgi:hypothetical protein